MNPGVWFITGVLVLLIIVGAVLMLIPAFRRYAVVQTGTSVGLAVPEQLEPALRRRFVGRSLTSLVGALLGLVVAVASLQSGLVPSTESTDVGEFWIVFGGFFAGASVAAAIYALAAKPARPEGARYARSGAVDLRDYLAPIDRLGARAAVALGVVTLIAATAVSAAGLTNSNAAVSVGGLIVVAGVVALALSEFASRRILDRPQPAGSPAELAWDDALRAQSLREIVTAPLSLGSWGALAVLFTLLDATDAVGFGGIATFWVGAIGLAIVLIALFAAAGISIATKPQQHYLRRLWPDVAATAKAETEARVAALKAGH
jgi:hypothetical protein